MRTRVTLVLLAALAVLVAALCYATPDGEYVCSSTEGVRLVPTAATGPILIECLADGPATVVLVSTSRSNRNWPDDGLGDSGAVFNLRDGIARPFYVAGDDVDSLDVDITGGATEVVITWTIN